MRMMRFMPFPKPASAEELDANRKTVLSPREGWEKKELPMGGAAYFSEYVPNPPKVNPADLPPPKRYSMVVFLGKSSKAYDNVYYRSAESRQEAFDKYLEGAKLSAEYKAKQKDANKPSNEGVAVGDIFVGSGGYDQTNVEALQVVELVGKSSVKVRKVGFTSEGNPGGSSMSDNVKPVKDFFLDVAKDNVSEAQAKYAAEKGGTKQVRNGYIKGTWGGASKWDGKRSYYSSWYA